MSDFSAGDLGAAIPEALPEEFAEVLARGENVRIERVVSRGHSSPPGHWYDQDENEWVLLVQGKARLRFAGDRVVHLAAGGYVDIPAHCRHRVEWTAQDIDTVWLAVFY